MKMTNKNSYHKPFLELEWFNTHIYVQNVIIPMQTRRATIDDIDELVKLRRFLFESMGITDQLLLDLGDQANRTYFTEKIPIEEFYGWVAIKNERIVASGGLVIDQHPPSPNNPTGRIAYIMNMVTLPVYQRRGLARAIFTEIMSFIKSLNISHITLHATKMGKRLYEEFGFETANEMKKIGNKTLLV